MAIPDSAFVTVPTEKPAVFHNSPAAQASPIVSLPSLAPSSTRQQSREAEKDALIARLLAENAQLKALPPGIGELRLFAGAANHLEAVKERASRKRRDFKCGMSGGMSLIGLEELLMQEEEQKERQQLEKRQKREEREQKKEQRALDIAQKKEERERSKIERERAKLELKHDKETMKRERKLMKLEDVNVNKIM